MRPLVQAQRLDQIGVERFRGADVTAWLRRTERQGTIIGALCTGTYVLAQAGRISGITHSNS